MLKLIPVPINIEDIFEYEDRTYYKTKANKYLVSAEKINTFIPTLKHKSSFCELISKKEFSTKKTLFQGKADIKTRVQLTLFLD